MTSVFFVYFAVVSVASAVLTVALRNPVQCGIALLSLLGHIAGLFVLLHAEFLAAVQIIIYAGAILILYLFVLMMLNLKSEERYVHRRYAWYVVGMGALSIELMLMLLASNYAGVKGTATVTRSSKWATAPRSASSCSAITSCRSKSSESFSWAPLWGRLC